MERLVFSRLHKPAPTDHLPAESLAAFAENALPRVERERALAHLAECHDCRQVSFLAQPQIAEQPVFLAKRSRSINVFRWAALTASVGIIAAGILFSKYGPVSGRGSEIALKQMPAEQPFPKIADGNAAPRDRANNPTALTNNSVPEPNGRPEPKHMTAAPKTKMQFDSTDQVRISSPVLPTAAQHLPTQAVQSPPAKWVLTANGELQRSIDQGKSWQEVSVNGSVSGFRAVSSSGPQVWVGGEKGALYHSTDSGLTWTRVVPTSGGQQLTADINRIDFADANNGLVGSAGGETWTTKDGGHTWILSGR